MPLAGHGATPSGRGSNTLRNQRKTCLWESMAKGNSLLSVDTRVHSTFSLSRAQISRIFHFISFHLFHFLFYVRLFDQHRIFRRAVIFSGIILGMK